MLHLRLPCVFLAYRGYFMVVSAYNLILRFTGEDWFDSNADPQPLKPDYLHFEISTTRRGLRGFSQRTFANMSFILWNY
jgi:hypothetical protein